MTNLIPVVDSGDKRSDIYSKLLDDRIIFLTGEINLDTSELVVAQLLYLESVDPNKDINMYINSPGGQVLAGLAIYDTMNFITCDVSTCCIGHAMSMGSFLLCSGAKGKRFSLPSSDILIHQPLGGIGYSQQTDIEIHAAKIKNTRIALEAIYSKNTGKSIEQVHLDMERDNYMSANEALDYGLIDAILEKRPS